MKTHSLKTISLAAVAVFALACVAPLLAENNTPPEGFISLFNGKDLTGWKGLLKAPNDNPNERAKLKPEDRAKAQADADKFMKEHWSVKDGVLIFDGKGFSLATAREDYGDFEMLVDWMLPTEKGDSGIYLRGAPQVQIWDPGYRKIGSGGLYNNKTNPSNPTKIADKPIGQWNTFRIKMVGDKVTVDLNGERVVDNVVMENYWDYSKPIFPLGQIELQCHGDPIHFRNIYIREIQRPGLFRTLFNGRDLAGWVGDTTGYVVEDGTIACKPGGNLYTAEQFADFHFKFDFKVTPAANNGVGIRAPLKGDSAYAAMEIQILEDTDPKYKDLQPYQFHGSIYGVVPAKRGFSKKIGEWDSEEIIAKGPHIQVILNGTTIVDADINEAGKDGTMDHKEHPGLKNPTGHIGFLGHGDVLWFRNIQVMDLKPQ